MSIKSAAKKIEKIAGLESDLILDARAQRASKIKGELKRRNGAIKKNGGAIKKRKINYYTKTTSFKTFNEFFKSFKLVKNSSVKSQFFYYLSKNRVFDMTDISPHSQMDIVTDALRAEIDKSTRQMTYKSGKLDNLVSKILKTEGRSLSAKLKAIKEINPVTNLQRVQQEVSRFILDLHVHKPYIFNSNNILLYSEEDFKLKFWSHIFEELFSTSNVCLHWGDTVPFVFKYTEASPKVDLRIISTMSCKEGDHSLCEFSKIAETTKLYHDKLKLTLMAKHHVNSLIDNNNIHSHYPLVMIMGFEFIFMSLEFVEDIGYIMKQIDRCCFPITKKAVNEGGIETLIKCIYGVKCYVSSIKDQIEAEKQQNTLNKLVHLIGSEEKKKTKYSTTPVIWPKSRDGLFFVEIASNVPENVPELFLQRNQSDDQNSDEEEEEEEEEEKDEEAEDGEDDNDDDREN